MPINTSSKLSIEVRPSRAGFQVILCRGGKAMEMLDVDAVQSRAAELAQKWAEKFGCSLSHGGTA
ncbi:hypothetical protein [Amycolatopsis sp. DSM 110486]|uniref:hypothetical protein n=1 Tax=Amycolatopsis sp. DSM 110486 TaxID=2865832 RepID=UPI001C6A0A14|nr:hypothetical protein [Amycolatopsis sp. DSM 110486]QYN17447.1 hypothetical protein K1T34_32185 [Amycolatopsis sp. DSM 110486]